MVNDTEEKSVTAKSMKETSEKTENKIKKSNDNSKNMETKKEIDKKDIKTEITKLKSHEKNKTINIKKEEKTDKGFLLILGGIVILFLIYAFLFTNITTEKSLKETCLSYQNDPDLQYPCTCVPTIREKNESDLVDVKTDGVCTCLCDIGNNQTTIIEVRKAIK